MTIYQINSFLILAEQLNFTKAAEALHMTQPTLSKLISTLEDELKITLFYRDTRSVRLTSVGEAFLKDAKEMLKSYNNTILRAKSLQDGSYGKIRIGFVGHSCASILPKILRKFQVMSPDIDVQLRDYGNHYLAAEALNNDVIDVCFSLDKCISQYSDVEYKPLFFSRFYLIAHESHPLAALESVGGKELSQAEYVTPGRIVSYGPSLSEGGTVMDSLLHVATHFNFVPQVAHQTTSINNLLILVDAGMGVAVVGEHIRYLAPKGVKFIPITDIPAMHRAIMGWKNTNPNPVLPNLAEVVDTLVGDGEKLWDELMNSI